MNFIREEGRSYAYTSHRRVSYIFGRAAGIYGGYIIEGDACIEGEEGGFPFLCGVYRVRGRDIYGWKEYFFDHGLRAAATRLAWLARI